VFRHAGGQRRQAASRPAVQFDVIVTSNMFDDILSDEASQRPARSACSRTRRWATVSGLYAPHQAPRPTSRGRAWQTPRHLPLLRNDACACLSISPGRRTRWRPQRAGAEAGHRTRDIAAGWRFVLMQMTVPPCRTEGGKAALQRIIPGVRPEKSPRRRGISDPAGKSWLALIC
jgi:hypothetical protein